MNECLKLHKALSQAEVEYQQKFDAVKNFELGLLMANSAADVRQTLKEWERLKAEEQAAYNKREVARKAYGECLKQSSLSIYAELLGLNRLVKKGSYSFG